MSLTAIQLANGQVTSDTGYWRDMWPPSHLTVLQCVLAPVMTGGHIHVGTKHTISLSTSSDRLGCTYMNSYDPPISFRSQINSDYSDRY